MSLVRTLLALTLIPFLTGSAGAAVVGANGAKKGNKPVHGQVVAVQLDAAKGNGSITIRVHHHKKDSTPAAPVEKTFKLSAGTKVQIVQGKKGAVEQKAADMSALQKGENVLILHNGDDATDVKIVKKGKLKGAKKNA